MKRGATLDREIVVVEEPRATKVKTLFWLFFGLLAFVLVFMPMFGKDWRFRLSPLFSQIFEFIGNLSLFIGALIAIWGLFSLLCGSKGGGIKLMILGIMLILFAGYMLNPGALYFGGFGSEIPQGYK